MGQHYYDNFFQLTRDTPKKRLERVESDLAGAFLLRYEFSNLKIKRQPDGKLPLPRALLGIHSNADSAETMNETDRLYKFHPQDEDTAQHFTLEFVEATSQLRFARTYFLTNLSQHYMRDYWFS